jgi:pimeloyl-ACP methyl ester carboxylesterase
VAFVVLLIASLLVLGALAWPFCKAHLQAAAVLDAVAKQPQPPLLRAVAEEPIMVRDFTMPASTGPVRARLYIPDRHPDAPALIVLHGVHHLGIDEPRLVAFASAMAACGLRVLTPELPDIKDYHVGPNSIATIGDSARWMAAHNGGRAVGIMGLSFAGGLALMAAGEPQYRSSIKFVVTIGSQDEMSRVAAYFISGNDPRPNGSVESLPPHEYGALVLEYEHLEDFIPPPDIEPIRAVLRAHLYEDVAAEKQAIAALNPAQLVEAKLLMNTTSAATRALIAQSNAKHQADMAAVSPHGHLGTLTTPVYLLAGQADDVIPSAETQWMASELPRRSLQAELISPVLSHLDINGRGPGEWDRIRLVHFFALVLRAAEK